MCCSTALFVHLCTCQRLPQRGMWGWAGAPHVGGLMVCQGCATLCMPWFHFSQPSLTVCCVMDGQAGNMWGGQIRRRLTEVMQGGGTGRGGASEHAGKETAGQNRKQSVWSGAQNVEDLQRGQPGAL